MLEKIEQSLKSNPEIKAWNVRHVITRGSQQYDLAKTTEAIREISSEHYTIDVLCDSLNTEGKPSSGVGTVTVLPGGEINQTLDQAVLTAKLVHNEPYDFPEPSPLPDVELADQDYLKDPPGAIEKVLVSLKEQTASYPHVRLAAAECFGQEKITHLVSSKGINAQQNTTEMYLQWVYLAGEGEGEVETFTEIYQRRIADFNLDEKAARRAQYTSDLLLAEGPPSQIGPVFVQGGTLASMVAGEVLSGSLIQTLSAGEMKYSGETPWKIGKSIFNGDVKGDSFNIWANRQLPYGMHSNAFDAEGIPAQRIALIQENKLEAYITDQRFASYLDIPATGEFGNLELKPGKTSTEELTREPHIEIAEFSWFNPNPVTGDFACEIRLGYVVDGKDRKPFKGGLLLGNLLDALADVTWSSETGFSSNYLGPSAARFNNLQIAG